MRRGFRIVAQAAAGLVVLCMAAVVVLAWRLSRGPIDVPALVPYLEHALSRQDGGLVSRIDSCQIAWDARQREIDLVVHQLRVRTGGQELLHLPVASLEFSARALLAGRLVLRTVELPSPHVTLRPDASGNVQLGFAGETGEVESREGLLPALIAPRPGDPAAGLERVEVSDGDVTMIALGGRTVWSMTGADLLLARAPGTVTIAGACRLTVGTTSIPVRIDGSVDATMTPQAFTTRLQAASLAPRDILPLWPAATASDVREWITTRVRAGTTRDVQIAAGGRVMGDGSIAVDTVEGRFAFDGVAVQPLDRVPLVTGVSGRATFDRRHWRFDLGRGESGGLDVASGRVEIGAGEAAPLLIRANVSGPVERALPLVRHYAGESAVPAMSATGRVDASITLDIPANRPFDSRRHASARGRFEDLASPDVMGKRSLARGDFAFELERGVFTARGRATLGAVPGEITLRAPIGESPEVQASARLDAADRSAFGLDVGSWVQGATPVAAKVTMPKTGTTMIAVSADLREARLLVPALGMEKSPGTAGSASATVTVSGGTVSRVDDAVLRYGATQLRGRAALDGAGAVTSLDLSGTLGPVPGRKSPSTVTVRIAPGSPRRSLTADTDDVDLLFRACGMMADAEGGRLRFTGHLASESSGGVDGQVEGRDFALASAPMLARVLSTASLPGVTNLFAGQGLPVTRLAAGISYRAPRLTLTDGTLESPSLGMRLAGTIDTGGGAVACNGSLVPSWYGVNRMAHKVPVIGRVLTGIKQEGFQVFDFEIRGTTAAPRITVDPMASLAPGAMRDLLKLLPRPHVPVAR